MANLPIKLIINADDYGYFPCVSQGIAKAALSKSITATGIMANRPDLAIQLDWIKNLDNLDLGVHLNLTYGTPLTVNMKAKLANNSEGKFRGLDSILQHLLTKKITLNDVRLEWQAQIETCMHLSVKFLNSHEHIHMLPFLWPLTLELASYYNIKHVRQTRAEWQTPWTSKNLIRNSLLQLSNLFNNSNNKNHHHLIGLNASGKLTLDYLEKTFTRLIPGNCYELMCHPGQFDSRQINHIKLLNYHNWESELNLLSSPELKALYSRFNIHLLGYA